MLRTFHIDKAENSDCQLNISECSNHETIVLSITQDDKKLAIPLDYHQFNDLCGLKYSLELIEKEEPETTSLALCAA